MIPYESCVFFDRSLLQDYLLPIGEGIAGKVAENGVSIFVEDAYQHPDFHRRLDSKTGFRTESILSVPIVDRRHHVIQGVIQLLNVTSENIKRDQAILELLAEMVSSVLHRASLIQKHSRREKRMQILLGVSQLLGRADAMLENDQGHHLITSIVNAAYELIDAEHTAFFKVTNHEKPTFLLVASPGSGELEIDGSKGKESKILEGYVNS